MCLTVKKRAKLHTQEQLESMFKTADREITVYKVFKVKKRGKYIIKLISPYQNFEYHLGCEYSAPMNIRQSWGSITVVRGIHAFRANRKNCKMRGFNKNTSNDFVIIPCKIPVGAKYIKGQENEITSDTLILPDHFMYCGEEYNINY